MYCVSIDFNRNTHTHTRTRTLTLAHTHTYTRTLILAHTHARTYTYQSYVSKWMGGWEEVTGVERRKKNGSGKKRIPARSNDAPVHTYIIVL